LYAPLLDKGALACLVCVSSQAKTGIVPDNAFKEFGPLIHFAPWNAADVTLGDRHKGDLLLVKQLQEFGEVRQGSGQPVDLAGHDDVRQAPTKVIQQAL